MATCATGMHVAVESIGGGDGSELGSIPTGDSCTLHSISVVVVAIRGGVGVGGEQVGSASWVDNASKGADKGEENSDNVGNSGADVTVGCVADTTLTASVAHCVDGRFTAIAVVVETESCAIGWSDGLVVDLSATS